MVNWASIAKILKYQNWTFGSYLYFIFYLGDWNLYLFYMIVSFNVVINANSVRVDKEINEVSVCRTCVYFRHWNILIMFLLFCWCLVFVWGFGLNRFLRCALLLKVIYFYIDAFFRYWTILWKFVLFWGINFLWRWTESVSEMHFTFSVWVQFFFK